VIRFRPYRNSDPPALAELWNRTLPSQGVVKPLSAHDFDTLVMGKHLFDPAGLIVGERDGRVVGFAHAGFGPVQPEGPSHRLDHDLGTIAMLAVESNATIDEELESGLVREAIAYLRGRGAQVIYAGGQYPLNPFYWGIYGGSEFAGVLGSHTAFHRAALRARFEPVSQSRMMEADLARPEPRDPRSTLLRRQVRTETPEDVRPSSWWQAIAIGTYRPCRVRLISRGDGAELARAMTWDIASGFGLGDGRPRTGLIDVFVQPTHRRRGLGRLLIAEVFRHARDQLAEIVVVQVAEDNHPAFGLYSATGFETVETATLYRLPAGA
jgi:ribosomal protein S18 acetylase RimI-like enzyme